MIRPVIKKATVPAGEIAIRSEPRTLSAKPTWVIFNRPRRSARPPATTMKIPENRAVMLTAILFRLSLIRNSSRIAGATFSVVCAKSQKLMTARTMPRISLLAPRCVLAVAAAVVELKTRTSLRKIRQSGNHECLSAVGQRRFNDRCKEFRVIDGNVLLQTTRIESALVFLGIGATNAPVSIRSSERVRDVAEIFAGGLPAEVEDGFRSKMAPECGRDFFGHFRVIVSERVLIEILEFRRAR